MDVAFEQVFASRSVPRHIARGLLGAVAFVAAFVLLDRVGAWSLLLLPIAPIAWRGCPTCWTIGLVQTASRGRLERRCIDGRCDVVAAPPN